MNEQDIQHVRLLQTWRPLRTLCSRVDLCRVQWLCRRDGKVQRFMLHLGLSSQPNSMYGPTCALGCSCQSFAFRRRRAKRGRRLLRTSHLTGSRADAIIVLEGHWRISPALLACTVRSGVPSSSRFLMLSIFMSASAVCKNTIRCARCYQATVPTDLPRHTACALGCPSDDG